MHTKSYKYPLLNDKEFLYQKYITEGLSTIEIAKLVGAKTCNSARQALIRCNIPVRDGSEAQTHKRESDGFIFNEHSQQVIEGSLLGDGLLRAYNKKSKISYPLFSKVNKYRDHIEYVANQINLNNTSLRIRRDKYIYKNQTKFLQYYTLTTSSHIELLSMYRSWYPKWNGYKKLIPRTLVLTPTVLLHWFMDDGWATIRSRRDYEVHWNKKKQISIGLCTDCFSFVDHLFLQNELKTRLDLRFSIKALRNNQFRLILPQLQAEKFYSIIGPCPVPSLEYKWKL